MSDADLKVLLVDDDADCRDFLSMAMDMQGITLQTAASAEEGILCLKNGPWSVIISDINLPGMDGEQFIKIIRQQCGQIPVIVITGDTNMDTPETIAKIGAQACITKPIDDMQLAETLRKLAGKS
jgi:two-component system response regulator FlrC